jgi:hypothetical protein
MSNGTMIRNRPRTREDEGGELADRRPGQIAARASGAAKVLGVATAVAVTGAGMFALLGPGQTVRGEDPRLAASAGAPAPAGADAVVADAVVAPAAGAEVVRGAKPGKVAPAFQAASIDLPPAKSLSPAARRDALLTYLEQGGVPVATAPAKLVRAARNTCTALDDGTSSADFAADLARIAGYTAVQSTRFVTAATHFYCPRHSGGELASRPDAAASAR